MVFPESLKSINSGSEPVDKPVDHPPARFQLKSLGKPRSAQPSACEHGALLVVLGEGRKTWMVERYKLEPLPPSGNG